MATTLLIQSDLTPLEVSFPVIAIYRPQQSPQILENPETVSADPELSGFTLSLVKIW